MNSEYLLTTLSNYNTSYLMMLFLLIGCENDSVGIKRLLTSESWNESINKVLYGVCITIFSVW